MNDNKDVLNVQNKEEAQDWETVLENECTVAPLVDIYETDDDFAIVANMPGVTKENVKLKLEEESLTIFGKINYDEAVSRKYVLNENAVGNYYRKFRISNSIDETKISAKYENGQLIVNLPKHDRLKPRTINIQ